MFFLFSFLFFYYWTQVQGITESNEFIGTQMTLGKGIILQWRKIMRQFQMGVLYTRFRLQYRIKSYVQTNRNTTLTAYVFFFTNTLVSRKPIQASTETLKAFISMCCLPSFCGCTTIVAQASALEDRLPPS